MIVDLPNTTVSKISKELVRLREEGGAVALGRVLTLIIATDPGREEAAIDAANAASREHPMRVIVLSPQDGDGGRASRIDAQIRVGGDAGASEVIVLHSHGEADEDEESLVTGLLLPDAPVVVWWSGPAPECVAESPLGRIAQRRITDAAEASADPLAALRSLAANHRPGDTDFAWTRTTLWRSQLAAVLDQPPYEPVTRAQVVGSPDSPSALLLAAWLGLQLQVEVELETTGATSDYGIAAVRLHRPSGVIAIERLTGNSARLSQPAQPVHEITLHQRTNRECLAEELRRLDPDELFERVISEGLGSGRTVEA